MKKLIILSILLLSSYLSFSQTLPIEDNIGSIDVPAQINGSIKVTTNEIAVYKFNFERMEQWRWNVHGGIILKSSKNEITVQWTSKKNQDQAESEITTVLPGNDLKGGLLLDDLPSPSSSNDIELNGRISFSFAYRQNGALTPLNESLNIEIIYNPTPTIPIVKRQNCNEIILQKLPEPHADVTWYWQGQNSEGTSTANAATIFRATQSGTYYLRGYNSKEGKFSIYSIPFEAQLKNCIGTSSDDENYIHTTIYKTPYKEHELSSANVNNKLQQTIYYDALGRPKQIVAIRAGGTEKDIITHIEYDSQGRKEKEYLPYSDGNTNIGYRSTNVPLATQTYYKSRFSADFNSNTPTQDINAYAQKVYDNSPLNRVIQQAAPGNDWKAHGGHTVDFRNDFNTSQDMVKKYNVSLMKQGQLYNPTLVTQGSYTKGELYKNTVKDENHDGTASKLHTVEEFKNSRGQVVLKRTYAIANTLGLTLEEKHDTYYVYDDFGNLTYVIPPKVNTNALNGISATELSELCYQYKYDHRNRLVEKKIPGKGWEYIVYDKLDRPVLTQDALQKPQRKWLFTKYDKLGRIIYTGIYTHGSIYSQAQMQNYVNTVNNTAVKHYETKQSSTGSLGIYYSNSDFPTTNLEVLTVSYYDNYTFNRAGTGTSVSNVYGVNSTSRLKGLTTGSRVKVLGTSNWITTVTYYDEKARPIYVYSKNDELKTIDIVENKLDFTGKSIEVRTTHKREGQETVVIVDSFIYDHSGRLLSQQQCIGDVSLISCSNEANSTDIVFSEVMILSEDKIIVDNNSITLKEGFQVTAETGKSIKFTISEVNGETIVSNEYDELGQLKSKKIGGNLQKVDYKYNIRGWLKDINQDDDTTDNDLFNFTINYNKPQNGATALFNGNISETHWNTLSVNNTSNLVSNRYVYSYDALNRIIGAKSDVSGNYSLGGFDASGNLVNPVTYDKNGNILTLQRRGHTQVDSNGEIISFGLMDNLKYDYNANNVGNKLVKVQELTGGNPTFGFKDGINTTVEYTYDANGNMTKDLNKGITNITYNHLNLPVNVNLAGGTINYTYDAAGNKLRKIANRTTTEYAGNYKYINGTLEFFNHAEGYVQKDGSSFSYVYQYKDHLGNVRLSYMDNNNDGVITPSTEIIEESNYYPFGLKHKGYNKTINGVHHKYGMYNGVEYEETLGLNLYEMDVRMYDPALSRFNGIDPVTHFSQGTSVAFDNNPIYWADPSGANSTAEWMKKHGLTDDDLNNVYDADLNNVYDANSDNSFGGNADGINNSKVDDHVVNPDKKELQTIVTDLNTIFKRKFGETPFTVEKQVRNQGKEDEYTTYVIKGSVSFDWEQHHYTRMLRDILESSEDVTVDIMNGARGRELMNVYGGGEIMGPNRVELSNLLIQKKPIKNVKFSFGGVTLHELLRHVHVEGDVDSPNANVMRSYFLIKRGGNYPHPRGEKYNRNIKGTGYTIHGGSIRSYLEFLGKNKK